MTADVYRVGATPPRQGGDLADLLERILDKGVVIAGDVRIDLLQIELLNIKLRLLVAGVDRAREMGISWWEEDPFLTSTGRALVRENSVLHGEVESLKAKLDERETELRIARGES